VTLGEYVASLTREQQEKLEQQFQKLIPGALQFFQKIEGLKPNEREEALGKYRPKAQQELAALLKQTLNEGQLKRLRQLELQREGLFGSGDVWVTLQVSNEQSQQLMAVIQQTQKKIAPLMEEAQKGGNHDEIRSKVLKMREDLQSKMVALLTDAQKKQWKEMLGKPVDHMSLLFDDVSSR
jgi:hypothetical protein